MACLLLCSFWLPCTQQQPKSSQKLDAPTLLLALHLLGLSHLQPPGGWRASGSPLKPTFGNLPQPQHLQLGHPQCIAATQRQGAGSWGQQEHGASIL